ncbi:hypothetical protein MTO96_034264 [Rhipicephalus appendiculatus]
MRPWHQPDEGLTRSRRRAALGLTDTGRLSVRGPRQRVHPCGATALIRRLLDCPGGSSPCQRGQASSANSRRGVAQDAGRDSAMAPHGSNSHSHDTGYGWRGVAQDAGRDSAMAPHGSNSHSHDTGYGW